MACSCFSKECRTSSSIWATSPGSEVSLHSPLEKDICRDCLPKSTDRDSVAVLEAEAERDSRRSLEWRCSPWPASGEASTDSTGEPRERGSADRSPEAHSGALDLGGMVLRRLDLRVEEPWREPLPSGSYLPRSSGSSWECGGLVESFSLCVCFLPSCPAF